MSISIKELYVCEVITSTGTKGLSLYKEKDKHTGVFNRGPSAFFMNTLNKGEYYYNHPWSENICWTVPAEFIVKK